MKLPDIFKGDMKEILGDQYDAFISSYDLPSYKGLRINSLKLKNETCLHFSLSQIPWCGDGFYYLDKDAPGKHIYHEMGLYYIQEPSAMAPVEELDVVPNDRVLDMCAAPGGKSTQIASRLQGKGLLVSNEIIPSRAKILSSNIERMGIKNALVLNETPQNVSKHFKSFFNKILVDAPCSGEGMFRKNEAAINEWSEDNVQMCASRQLEILDEAYKCLMPGGKMVFSTCTFSKVENEGVIEKFLNKYEDMHLVPSKNKFKAGLDKDGLTQRLYPHLIKGEGHFFAVLQKDGKSDFDEIKLASIKQDKDFEKFIKDNLNVSLTYNVRFGDNLYLSPYTKLDGLKVMRAGLHLGEIKKNRFEPSHSLALALSRDDFKRVIDLSSSSKEASRYVQGETIDTTCVGWGVVCVDGFTLGLFKGDGRIAKNHYPKGLRLSF